MRLDITLLMLLVLVSLVLLFGSNDLWFDD